MRVAGSKGVSIGSSFPYSLRVAVRQRLLPPTVSDQAAVAISPKFAMRAVQSPAQRAPELTAAPQALAAKERYEAIQVMEVMKPATPSRGPTPGQPKGASKQIERRCRDFQRVKNGANRLLKLRTAHEAANESELAEPKKLHLRLTQT